MFMVIVFLKIPQNPFQSPEEIHFGAEPESKDPRTSEQFIHYPIRTAVFIAARHVLDTFCVIHATCTAEGAWCVQHDSQCESKEV